MSSFTVRIGKIFERLPLQDRINFAQHLAIIIKAGLPVFEGLKIIRRQTKSKTLLKIIDQIIIDVNNGLFLADSLAKFRNVFGDFFVNIIRVGEASGTLAPNLIYLAEEMAKSKDLRSKVHSAMVYPIVILVLTIGIVGLLIFSIFPKVLPIFTSMKAELPITTKILIAVSNFLLNYGGEFILGIVVLFIIFEIIFKKVPGFRFFLYRAYFLIPVLNNLIININIANFTRVLSILLRSGIKIVDALKITSQTLTNPVYKKALTEAADEVQRGEEFYHYLERRRIFPPLAAGLIEIGENTGNLEENLIYLSEYYTKETETTVKNLATIIEPTLLLFMGVLVGFVALSIITPIYQVTSSIH